MRSVTYHAHETDRMRALHGCQLASFRSRAMAFLVDLAIGGLLFMAVAVILAYALLGFANFSSIAIQIGGIGGLAPERRGEIARFGLRAMVAGNLAAFMSACWAGMLL